MPSKPTAEEVVGYMETLSNRGRWGAEDTKGTLNLISAAKRAQAAPLCATVRATLGKMIPHLGMAAWSQGDPQSLMLQSGERYMCDESTNSQFQIALEQVSFIFHGETFTHVDDMSHVSCRGKMYNGARHRWSQRRMALRSRTSTQCVTTSSPGASCSTSLDTVASTFSTPEMPPAPRTLRPWKQPKAYASRSATSSC